MEIMTNGETYKIKNKYIVSYKGCDGDENIGLWECDCPAGKHGRTCKHLKALFQWFQTEPYSEECKEGEMFEIN